MDDETISVACWLCELPGMVWLFRGYRMAEQSATDFMFNGQIVAHCENGCVIGSVPSMCDGKWVDELSPVFDSRGRPA